MDMIVKAAQYVYVRWMDGRMDGWMDGWVNGWIDWYIDTYQCPHKARDIA